MIRLLQGDITEQSVDAIVNAANASLLGGGGVDGAIHRRGGPEILDACRSLRASQWPDGLPTGEAVLTTAGALPAKHVIHTVGPVWRGGQRGEAALLRSAYVNSLACAKDAGLETVAFPSISTGAYGYPIESAAGVAVQAVTDVLRDSPGTLREVRFVLFTASDLLVYERALAAMRQR